MNIKFLPASILISSILLVACNNEYSDRKSKEIHSKISQEIETDMNKAIDEAKLDSKDVSVDLIDGGQAVISANGDLSIAGKKIELSASQRAWATRRRARVRRSWALIHCFVFPGATRA